MYLEVVFIDGLGQIVHVHVSIKGKGRGALHEALKLGAAEVLGLLGERPQIHVCRQKGVALHPARVDLDPIALPFKFNLPIIFKLPIILELSSKILSPQAPLPLF